MATAPPAAAEHYATSALIAAQAVSAARSARPRGLAAVVQAILRYQAANAIEAEAAVGRMLAQQDIDIQAEALLNSLAFTTETDNLLAMLDATGTDSDEFDRLVASLVQDAGRAAESVAVVTRPNIAHVRFEPPPSCPRCVVLDQRVYRWSEGFARHPGCDGIMIPTTVANGERMRQDPLEMLKRGEIIGLSKADARALRAGADLAQLVNIRRSQAGLRVAGRVLARRGRLTPEGIYSTASSREEALDALAANGYLL